jgi:hypothetical protein
MNKNHFLISYAGNKRKECERIYEEIKHKLNDVEIIIEPFCGSCAFSYYLSTKHPKQFKYIINDSDKFLIELIELSKDENKLNDFVEKLKTLFDETNSKEKYLNVCKSSKTDLLSYIYIHKVYCIRAGLYPTNKVFKRECFDAMKICPFLNFIRNEKIEIMNKDAIEVYDVYIKNKKALIFLDPPYLDSCNDFYQDPKTNIYEYLYNNDIDKESCKILLCLEKNWIIQLLFKNKNILEYDKKYQPSKKDTKHLLIKNKNI